MTSLRVAQVCQRSEATRSAMSQLLERHISKTKFVKLLTVPIRGCSEVKSPVQYQLSRATIHPKKACQSFSTTVSHQGHIISHCTCRDYNRRRVGAHSLQILHNEYELYEGNSPSRFYATLLQRGIDQYVATPS